MHVYFAGIGGVALGPLAEIAQAAGYEVSGSDITSSLMTEQLKQQGINVAIGQTGREIAALHVTHPIDWVVATASLRPDNPEILFAQGNGIRVSKRDELINHIIHTKKLKLVAITGTHGKTTTTAMLVWLFKQFSIPVSYSVGTTLPFGPSGAFTSDAEYFIYEADEYDRNMLKFNPHVSIITSVDYDHPDTYPTVDDYKHAFTTFIQQSRHAYLWEKDARYLELPLTSDVTLADRTLCAKQVLTLAGLHNRNNAYVAMSAFTQLFPEFKLENVAMAMNHFPGSSRRFEKLADNLYTDYAHHPAEIAATLQLAREVSEHVVAVYQPHQNLRQHEVRKGYKDCFALAEHLYWLPTYLTREDQNRAVLTPKELITSLDNSAIAEPAGMDEALLRHLRQALQEHKLVLVLGAGDVDPWLRKNLASVVPDKQ